MDVRYHIQDEMMGDQKLSIRFHEIVLTIWLCYHLKIVRFRIE